MRAPVLDCHAATPQVVARQLHDVLARLICSEQYEHGPVPCAVCRDLAVPLVRPVAYALFVAAAGGERPLAFEPQADANRPSPSCGEVSAALGGVLAMYDRYARVGHALEVLERGGSGG